MVLNQPRQVNLHQTVEVESRVLELESCFHLEPLPLETKDDVDQTNHLDG